jgi:S1-C subfamily serine protease
VSWNTDLDRFGDGVHVPAVRVHQLLGLALLTLAAASPAAETELSVVQVINFGQQPAWDAPWRFETVQRGSGSGFVIKGKRIMTNAHVVSWARQIIVRRYQDPRPYLAEVEFIAHDCDLAVLRIKDERFFEEIEPLEFGGLPKVRSTVVTYGYPAGGEEISYTRGVVSRIERQPYSHTGIRHFLACQTDAAINPGNSGGPVVQEDRVVGVAFQGMQGLENAGFFIPPPIIQHFLKDIEDGRYDGFPRVGIQLAGTQSPAYRSWLKLPDNGTGARVDRLLPICNKSGVLLEEDVLLRIGDYPVASDATILFEGNRVSAGVAFQLAQVGDTLPIQVWRDGKEISLQLPMEACEVDRAAGFQYDVLPRYFVHGGLVFTPLSLDFLRAAGIDAADPGQGELIYELRMRPTDDPRNARPEPVVLATVLPHEINANWSVRGRAMVDRINGVRIEKLEDVVRAFEQNRSDFDVVEFVPHHAVETLPRAKLAGANTEILSNYGIPSDRRL